MQMFRKLLLVVCVGVFSINEGSADPEDDKKNEITTSAKRLKKRKIVSDENDNGNQDVVTTTPKKPEKEMVPVFSPLLKDTPTKVESKFWAPFRTELVLAEYKTGEKCAVLSPEVRKIYQENDPGNLFKRIEFEKKIVFQADFLFNPEDKVLNKKGRWRTNLKRMKKGLAPVSRKGITREEERSSLEVTEIKKKQKSYRIELQHVTQKDTGSDQDPIVEMTHIAHMGKNSYFILKHDNENKTISILHSNIIKEEAIRIIEEKKDENLIKVANVLHFRKGASLIKREEFNPWRKVYWKHRAKEIENGNFTNTLPEHVEPSPIIPRKETVKRKLNFNDN